jgi:hypothetical protein
MKAWRFRRKQCIEHGTWPKRRATVDEDGHIASPCPSDDGAYYTLERDDFSSNRYRALSFCLSMIFSENR